MIRPATGAIASQSGGQHGHTEKPIKAMLYLSINFELEESES